MNLVNSSASLVDAALLGLGTWAVGYLSWLPATGLMPPVQYQGARKVAMPAAQHILFGLATVAMDQVLRRLL
jgi:hypothetical protein